MESLVAALPRLRTPLHLVAFIVAAASFVVSQQHDIQSLALAGGFSLPLVALGQVFHFLPTIGIPARQKLVALLACVAMCLFSYVLMIRFFDFTPEPIPPSPGELAIGKLNEYTRLADALQIIYENHSRDDVTRHVTKTRMEAVAANIEAIPDANLGTARQLRKKTYVALMLLLAARLEDNDASRAPLLQRCREAIASARLTLGALMAHIESTGKDLAVGEWVREEQIKETLDYCEAVALVSNKLNQTEEDTARARALWGRMPEGTRVAYPLEEDLRETLEESVATHG